MPIAQIEHNGRVYPAFQAEGNAAQFVVPFAHRLLFGRGVDVGFSRPEWLFGKNLPFSYTTIVPEKFLQVPVDKRDWTKLTDTELHNNERVGKFQRAVLGIDLAFHDGKYHATHFPAPASGLDFVFSSHCLEHTPHWVQTLDYWKSRLALGGVLFLYLPDYSQTYWRPWHNRKHVHALFPDLIRDYLLDQHDLRNVHVSGVDLNHSFLAIAQKCLPQPES